MLANRCLPLLLLSFLVFHGCAKSQSEPTLHPELTQTTSSITLLAGGAVEKVTTEVKMPKAELLGRTFLYGATIQTGSIVNDQGERETYTSIALGLHTARFAIVNDRLRLLADTDIDFESDVNRPERLIQEFPILSQDGESITFRADQAAPALNSYLTEAKTGNPRSSWIRSLEFAEKDDLLLIQSSIELSDGSIAEFMETLTPREKLVPADAKPIYDDSTLNPLASRYQFLSSDEIFVNHPQKGRIKTKVAKHFLVQDKPIDWYVTRNIPEKYLLEVKNGIEGWNRYAGPMGKGPLVRFAGLLPEGIAVGDPRYNLVVWDNISQADSAYTSQNADPLTGITVNSIIYLPAAWVEMGKSYWEVLADSEPGTIDKASTLENGLKRKSFLGRPLPISCMSSPRRQLSVYALESPESFGRILLKGTLFHEVGHALGLGHNFRGSVSFIPEAEHPVYSDSIMDYNLYNEDVSAFTSPDGSEGPLFEYDRQIISVLYNDGKDVKDSDPKLLSCGDMEANSMEGGVDPLCVTYDLGQDPTETAFHYLSLLADPQAHLGRMSSLPLALDRSLRHLPEAAKARNLLDVQKALQEYATNVRILVLTYMIGSNSVGAAETDALKSLYVFRDGLGISAEQESAMRGRAYALLKALTAVPGYPKATQEALAGVRASVVEWLKTTPAIASVPEGERDQKLQDWMKSYDKIVGATEENAFSRLRAQLARSLKYSDTAPIGFVPYARTSLDTESQVILILEELAGPGPGNRHALTERAEAVKSLSTFRKVSVAQAAASRLRALFAAEIEASTDARARQSLRKMAEALEW